METVDHPLHYGGDTVYETIKVIEAWELGFHLGNCVKYISRAGKKKHTTISRLEDLKKARWYLNREIANLEGSARPAISSTPIVQYGGGGAGARTGGAVLDAGAHGAGSTKRA